MIKKALALGLVTTLALAQPSGNGVNGGVTQLLAGSNVTLSPANGIGNVTISAAGGGGGGTVTTTGTPTSGQFAEFTGATSITGETLGGDCTLSVATLTCLSTNGVAFGTAATVATGTSGATIPLLNGVNTWSGAQTFSSAPLTISGNLSSAASPTAGVGIIGTATPVYTDTSGTGGTISVFYMYALPAPNLETTTNTTYSNVGTLSVPAPTCSAGGGGTPTCTNLYSIRSNGLVNFVGGATLSGIVYLNANSNNITNINTGTSTSNVSIANGTGNSGVAIGNGTGKVTVGGPLLSANVNTSQFIVASGTGACATSGSVTGGVQAGSFSCTGTTGASTATLTLKGATTAYTCWGRDITTPTTLTQTGAVSTTSVTLTMTSVVANDVIQFGCLGY